MARWALWFVLAGCAALSKPGRQLRVETQDEAGSVHLAVLAVAPWQRYVEALQPHFELTPEQALGKVVRGTREQAEEYIDAAKLWVEAGEREEPPPPPPAPKTVVVQEAPAPPRPQLETDAMTEYWTATALYQEVQLLNRYVRDAALRDGHDAYVVRLQVTLLPRARREPYDAYATVSFFGGGTATPITDGRGEGDEPPPAATAPVVLPLLVTDNLEGARAARTAAAIRELGASVGVKEGALSAERLQKSVESVVGTDLNSLLTVARVSDNTLRVRLGAMQQGSHDYAMVPRSHNITLLLLVPPAEPATVEVVARITMVDAVRGTALRERTPEEVDAHLAAVGARHGIGLELARTLLPLAQQNRQEDFFAALEGTAAHGARRSLWLDLVSVMAGAQSAAVLIELPEAEEEELFPPQTAVVRDDGHVCVTTLSGGRALERGRLRATLVAGPVRLAALEIGIHDGGAETFLVFPSLKALGVDATSLELEIDHEPERETYDARYLPPPGAG